MTPSQRRHYRAKHTPRWNEQTPRGEYQCLECEKQYPCDVAELLDYLDIVEPLPKVVEE